jgi:hypothetical protein
MDIISSAEIEKTKTYQNLSPLQKQFSLKRNNREIINHALIVYKNTGYLDENIGRNYCEIVKELAETNNPLD